MKVHYKNIRLFNNAGMDFPECYAYGELLDLGKARLPMTGDKKLVTCKRCLRIMGGKR